MSADSGGLANAGTALSSGASGVGSNSFGFSMPGGFSSGDASPLAGLSGVQSGMSLPGMSGGANSFGFGMPGGGTPNIAGLAGSLGAASKALSVPTSTQQPRAGGGGGVSLHAQTFAPPIGALSLPAGSQVGQSLISLLAKYRPGGAT